MTGDDARGSSRNVPVRVAFCGMTGQFSLLVLEQLLRAGVTVVAVVLPAVRKRDAQLPRVPLPMSTPRGVELPMLAGTTTRTILDVAAERSIPVLELGGRETSAVIDALARLGVDALCVACFSRKIPPDLLRLPRLGCLNVHPSLLPTHRGPDPLFWIFHDDDEAGGVTIHLMDEGFDSGPILLSEALPLADETTEAALERACATRGGALLAQALAGLTAGTLHPRAQDEMGEGRASYQSWPTEDDYTITRAWSARRAYRFLVGVGGRGEPIRLLARDPSHRLKDATFLLGEPLGYEADATLDMPWQPDGDALAVQCTPGVLRCRLSARRDWRCERVIP
jgi:methionyl-tRNA formyltransferase